VAGYGVFSCVNGGVTRSRSDKFAIRLRRKDSKSMKVKSLIQIKIKLS